MKIGEQRKLRFRSREGFCLASLLNNVSLNHRLWHLACVMGFRTALGPRTF